MGNISSLFKFTSHTVLVQQDSSGNNFILSFEKSRLTDVIVLVLREFCSSITTCMCYTLIILLLLLFHDPVLQFLFLSGLFSFKKQKAFLILNATLKSYYSSRPDVAEIGVNFWWSNRFLSLKLLIYESCLRWVTVSFFPHDKGSLWNYAPLTVLFF